MATRVLGEGRSVVLIHGGPGAQGSLRGLAHDLAPFYQVYEHLQPRSEDGPATVELAIASLRAEAPRDSVWVGHSWGAMLALLAAPGASCAGIILVGSGTFGPDSQRVYRERMEAALGEAGRARKAELKEALKGAQGEQKAQLFAQLGALAEGAMSPELLPDPWPSELDPAGHNDLWADRMAMGDLRARLGPHACPVAMIHGDQDPHPGPEISDELHSAGIHVRLDMLQGAGHTPWREPAVRAKFLRLLRSEIDRLFVRI